MPACRDAVRRVWDWLDMSMSREASAGLAQAGEAVAFGQMHLSEGSPATTVITATLDVSPGDAVEPCVSSLPDGQVRLPRPHLPTCCPERAQRAFPAAAPPLSCQGEACACEVTWHIAKTSEENRLCHLSSVCLAMPRMPVGASSHVCSL